MKMRDMFDFRSHLTQWHAEARCCFHHKKNGNKRKSLRIRSHIKATFSTQSVRYGSAMSPLRESLSYHLFKVSMFFSKFAFDNNTPTTILYIDMQTVAVILAGGTGSRMNAEIPKQFLTLDDGKTILEHSVYAFERNEKIDEICIVSHPDWIEKTKEIANKNGWRKVKRIVAGGSERYLSTLAAIECYIDTVDDNFSMLLHDAARPFVSQETITETVEVCSQYGAAAVGIPSTDTIWQVNVFNSTIMRIPERSQMWQAQTPQAFRFDILRDAYQRALQDPQLAATDDCGVVARYMPEIKIHIVKGSPDNVKITYKNDTKKQINPEQ